MARFKEGVGTVWVHEKDSLVNMVSFAEGDDIPAWAREQMGDHLFDEADDGEFDIEKAKKADLEDEIDRRNDGREDDEKISKSGTKDDLVAALKADDAA